ncbi:metal-sensitive transcriptional regulator [Candidatus Chloroploca sp. M-50]|uniref:Metal-sensitive transcriptional regulator n=1 Tax=Candidatus Chloroploca mongolica TaxID=2528176 RepID=A0ABS4DBI1_9CHLR|nr:metal-sensitive transcriptional regulator [Candidatus Chloroploca mongolica]MBP1466804.1 metal-sensitive transcriptional regulator [Candidatus Chloroploca mongolica]
MNSEHKADLLKRLKTIEGHVRGVQRMVEADTYCINLLTQTRAIRQALTSLDQRILDEHLRTCVTTAIQSESLDERERVVRELLEVFEARQS